MNHLKQADQVPTPSWSEMETLSSRRPQQLPPLRLSGQRGIREQALMEGKQVEPNTMGAHLETPPTDMRRDCPAFIRVALNDRIALQELCTPRQSMYAADRRATVLNLDAFLKGEAIARGSDAEVEQIDEANCNSDASGSARLIMLASLSTTPGAIHGIREYRLVDSLQRPGRDPVAAFMIHGQDQAR